MMLKNVIDPTTTGDVSRRRSIRTWRYVTLTRKTVENVSFKAQPHRGVVASVRASDSWILFRERLAE